MGSAIGHATIDEMAIHWTKDKKRRAKRELRKIVPFWRDVLGLQNWRIIIEFHNNLPVDGMVVHRYQERVASISLHELLPVDEYEETLIHELIHVVYSPATAYVGALLERNDLTALKGLFKQAEQDYFDDYSVNLIKDALLKLRNLNG